MKETPPSAAEILAIISANLNAYMDKPWGIYMEPFHIIGGIYYVGNRYVSSFLIDTGEGLILIDAAFRETAYQLFDAIRKLGFDPSDIRHLFLSHAHVDHIGAARLIQEYSKCKVWLGSDDVFFLKERRDLIFCEKCVPDFTVDSAYNYNEAFRMGDVTIRFVHTPGHTPGTTSFFIETRHDGKKITCAMHGGLGVNGLTTQELRDNQLPVSLQRDFIEGLKTLLLEYVDVVLPSHMHNYDILALHGSDDGSGSIYIDCNAWKQMLTEQLGRAEEYFLLNG